MVLRANAPTPPKNSGRTDGWRPADNAEYFIKCPIYGHMINIRDLAEVLEHAGTHRSSEPRI
jgi:hypothetical protein